MDIAHSELGDRIERRYLGMSDDPVLHIDNYHRVRLKLDTRGNITEKTYFGVEGEPVLHRDGYHRFTGTFNSRVRSAIARTGARNQWTDRFSVQRTIFKQARYPPLSALWRDAYYRSL